MSRKRINTLGGFGNTVTSKVDTSKNGVLGEYRGEFYSRLSGQVS